MYAIFQVVVAFLSRLLSQRSVLFHFSTFFLLNSQLPANIIF